MQNIVRCYFFCWCLAAPSILPLSLHHSPPPQTFPPSVFAVWLQCESRRELLSQSDAEKCTLWGQHCRVTWVTVCFHFNLLYSTQRWRWVEVFGGGGGGGTVHRQRQDREERTNPFLVAKAELQLTRTCLASEDELWWGERELQDDWSRDGWGACVCSTWTWV